MMGGSLLSWLQPWVTRWHHQLDWTSAALQCLLTATASRHTDSELNTTSWHLILTQSQRVLVRRQEAQVQVAAVIFVSNEKPKRQKNDSSNVSNIHEISIKFSCISGRFLRRYNKWMENEKKTTSRRPDLLCWIWRYCVSHSVMSLTLTVVKTQNTQHTPAGAAKVKTDYHSTTKDLYMY